MHKFFASKCVWNGAILKKVANFSRKETLCSISSLSMTAVHHITTPTILHDKSCRTRHYYTVFSTKRSPRVSRRRPLDTFYAEAPLSKCDAGRRDATSGASSRRAATPPARLQ